MRVSTFLKNLYEIEERNEVVRKTLTDLEKIVPPLLTEEGVVGMFERDKERIKADYKKGLISRKEAFQQLKELEYVADNLEKYVFEVRTLLKELERETQEMIIELRRFREVPRAGVSIDYVKGRIKKSLREAEEELPKKEFGILDVSGLPKDKCERTIREFLEEYYSGVIVAQPRLREFIIELLHGTGVRFEVKEMASRIVFTVEGAR